MDKSDTLCQSLGVDEQAELPEEDSEDEEELNLKRACEEDRRAASACRS